MAKSTKFSIKVTFENRVTLSHVSSGKLQGEKGGQKTKKTLGVTKPRAEITTPVLHWDQTTDPINKKITLALKEVSADVTFSARIWVDKAIDKKSDCYKHVMDHELEHVKIWKSSVNKQAKDIEKAVSDATAPQMDAPEEIKLSEAAKFRDAAFKKIDAALHEAVQKCGATASAESKKIHTSAEWKKTNTLCADYLKG